MAAAPCKECQRRPKAPGRHRCATCQLRLEPIGEQVAAARQRLAMVPPELRLKRTAKLMRRAPEGCSWCAACQSWRDLEDFGTGATRCRACASAAQHGAMVAKTYGLTAAEYDALLALQGMRCAICRAKPKSKRLAVDHDHSTGAVRGLLCSRCNHDLMGAAWDSAAMAAALLGYVLYPPTSGMWVTPETAPPFTRESSAVRPSKPSTPEPALFAKPSERGPARPNSVPVTPVFTANDEAAGILAGLDLNVPAAHALYAELDRHLRLVDPAPF